MLKITSRCKKTKRVRLLTPIIATVLILTLTGVVLAQVVFTGEVKTDFTTPFDRIKTDTVGDVGQTAGCAPFVPGWDFEQTAFHYDCAFDTLWVGVDYPAGSIGGDAEGDGNPSNTHTCLAAVAGQDLVNLDGSESIAVGFDLNQDGTYDWIAGVDSTIGSGCGNARVAQYTCGANWAGCPPSAGFGAAPSLGAAMTLSACPSAAWPDFEFTITNFSTLYVESGFPPPSCSGSDTHYDWHLDFAVFSGSASDDGIGEDFMFGSVGYGPNTVVVRDIETQRPNYSWIVLAAAAILLGAGTATFFILRKRRKAQI
jgi:hypothetical protein